MKIYIVYFLFIVLNFTHKTCSQETYIPDRNFEAYLENNHMGNGKLNDGYVLTKNILNIEVLYIVDEKISDLTGIAAFKALKVLDCSSNNLVQLDVSNNENLIELYCNFNNLRYLNVSNNTKLTTLYCTFNKLSILDVSANINLSDFNSRNNQLINLNIKNHNNENLGGFDVRNNLDSLCISVDSVTFMQNYFPNFKDKTAYYSQVNCDYTYIPDKRFEAHLEANNLGNGKLNDHYVLTSKILKVNYLNISNLSIKNIKGIENFKSLKFFDCSFNELKKIDISNQNNLVEFNCKSNQLKKLNVSKNINLENLNCGSNQLKKLNVSKNINLKSLHCYFNNLKTLNVSKNKLLTELYCYHNKLEILNIKNKNNRNIKGFNTLFNPNLKCVKVDDKSYMEDFWSFSINKTVNYSKNCKIKFNKIERLKIFLVNQKIVVNLVGIDIKVFNMLGTQVSNQNLQGIYYAVFTNYKGAVQTDRFYIFNKKIYFLK